MFSKQKRATKGEVEHGWSKKIAGTFNKAISSTSWLIRRIKPEHIHINASASLISKCCPLQTLCDMSFPKMALQINQFERQYKNDIHCFHQIYTVVKDGKKYIYKVNYEDSPISELEAYSRAAIDFVAHGHVPLAAIPVYDDYGQFVGICSELIPNFQSIVDAPFEKKDFEIKVLEEKMMTMRDLIKLNAWAEAHHIDLYALLNEKNEKEKSKLENWSFLEDIDYVEEKRANLIKDISSQEAWFKNKEFETDNPDEIYKLVKKLAQDLINFRYAKGFGIVIPAQNIHENDDMHRRNMGRMIITSQGIIKVIAIDFDMAKWVILYHHKKSGFVDAYTRNTSSSATGLVFRLPTMSPTSSTSRFICTSNDIARWPHSQDAAPFYKCTADTPTVPERVKYWLKSVADYLGYKNFDINEYFSENIYREQDQKAFRTLVTNEAFVYYKFKTLFAYIVTSSKDYANLAESYVRKELNHLDGNMINTLIKHEEERLNSYWNEAFHMDYKLNFAYTDIPIADKICGNQAYLYLNIADNTICLMARNRLNIVETMILTPEELGDCYDSIKETLADPKKPPLSYLDKEALEPATAAHGYAQENTKFEFRHFLKEYGQEVKQEILKEFEDINRIYGEEIINIANAKRKCEECLAFTNKNILDGHIDKNQLQDALNTTSRFVKQEAPQKRNSLS